MSRLSRSDLQAIIERELPGSQLVETDDDAGPHRAVATDFDTPDVEVLREKFLGTKPRRRKTPQDDAGKVEAEPAPDEDVTIVPVRTTQRGDAWDRSTRPKAVVISEREGRIIGRQG